MLSFCVCVNTVLRSPAGPIIATVAPTMLSTIPGETVMEWDSHKVQQWLTHQKLSR